MTDREVVKQAFLRAFLKYEKEGDNLAAALAGMCYRDMQKEDDKEKK